MEHMLNLHLQEKVPFGSKVNKNKNICCEEKEHSGTKKTSLKRVVGLRDSYQQVLYVL